VKWLLALGAVLLGGGAFAARSPEPSAFWIVRKPILRGSEQEIVLGKSVPTIVASEAWTLRPAEATPALPAVSAPAALAESKEDSDGVREEMLALMARELHLTPEQRVSIDRILRNRDSQIASYHLEIRASKVFSAWAHERRGREILAESQAQISAALTPLESQRYYEMLESRMLVEGVSFEITPDLAVIR
jgi:hypothetical protein